jgi:predicted nucleotidyltransferase
VSSHAQPEHAGATTTLIDTGEACGYGSRARGSAGPESDIVVLITTPDDWLEGCHRFEVLNQLWGLLDGAA